MEFETNYVNGLEHGYARQWFRGKLVGGYRMNMGAGLDLWRDEKGRLGEEHHWLNGRFHGVKRFWNEDQRTVFEETYWFHGRVHGISRSWDSGGRLERGYPQFYIRDKRVTKAEYLKRSARSQTFPAYRPEDDRPIGAFRRSTSTEGY